MGTLDVSLPERVESFIRGVDKATTVDEIFDALNARLSQMGFDRFSYWLFWPPENSIKPLWISNYPQAWLERRVKEGYGSHDYVGRYATKSTTPFIWHDILSQHALTETQKQIFYEAASIGNKVGGTVPVHGPGAAKATLSVVNEMSPEEFSKFFAQCRHEVHLMATYVHEKTIRLAPREPLNALIKLTPRETEVLTWVAKGKSRWETGVILHVSEDTVKAHLENIRHKLGATNTTHAIAISLMHGMILP